MTAKPLIVFSILSVLFSCKDSKDSTRQVSEIFQDSLTEKQIGQMTYWISVPVNFEIKEEEGPDFSVFYFANSDTVAEPTFSGGLYFGNFPSVFPPSSDSCNVETINSEILGKSSRWTIYACEGEYSVQAIVDSNSEEGWNTQIHAFGQGKSKDEIYRILRIYSTLHKRN